MIHDKLTEGARKTIMAAQNVWDYDLPYDYEYVALPVSAALRTAAEHARSLLDVAPDPVESPYVTGLRTGYAQFHSILNSISNELYPNPFPVSND